MSNPLANPIDVNAQGLIGKPLDRVEGPLKVSGQAPYTYEILPYGKVAYGFLRDSGIGKGKITAIDTAKAESAPGVLLVMTHRNAPKQTPFGPAKADSLERPKPYLDHLDIRYHGEPVAFVVAESFEEARAAAALIDVTYAVDDTPRFAFKKELAHAFDPHAMGKGKDADSRLGDFETAFANAPVKIDASYTTPPHHSQPMEPHASLAAWQDGKLTLHCAHQLLSSAQTTLCKTLNLKKDEVRIISKYIGGGFGSKLDTLADAILASLAARELGRPVKVAFTRQQIFVNATHRAESLQRIRLGADLDGKLTAIGHDSITHTASFDQYIEQAALQTRALYAALNRKTGHRLVTLDIPSPGSVRAPGEAIGMLALEQAMDELAIALDLDPIELRLRNEPTQDPEKHIPFSTRKLTECLREGASRFGWENRPRTPGSKRDGQWLIGYGVASAYRSNYLQKSKARVRLEADGHLTVETGMSDPGTGSYTILTQIAAEAMQLPPEQVNVVIGDTDLPETPGSGGSWGANSAGSGVYEACIALRKTLAKAAVADAASPLHELDAEAATFSSGAISIAGKRETYLQLASRLDAKSRTAEGEIDALDTYKTYSQAAYGGHFAEVGVDADTGEVRLRRMLGVFAAGRILNEKTARSQAIGGMIWGLSSALMEGSVIDPRYGHFVNHDFAEYHIPVHADAVDIDAIYLPEIDDKTGPLKIKGVGELGICGSGAAVANAVYNACGIRVRDYPITLDKILPHLA